MTAHVVKGLFKQKKTYILGCWLSTPLSTLLLLVDLFYTLKSKYSKDLF